MKEQEVLILVFVVLVIAVVMMKSKKSDTKPSGGGTPTPPTPKPKPPLTKEAEVLKSMTDGQFVLGTVRDGNNILNNNQDDYGFQAKAGDRVSVTLDSSLYNITPSGVKWDPMMMSGSYFATLDRKEVLAMISIDVPK